MGPTKTFQSSFVIFFALYIVSINRCYAKTAPEFQVTVESDNFKEIRIPLAIWNKIITADYAPSSRVNTKPANPKKRKNAPKTSPDAVKPIRITMRRPGLEGVPEDLINKKPANEFVIEIVVPAGTNIKQPIVTFDDTDTPIAATAIVEDISLVTDQVASDVPASQAVASEAVSVAAVASDAVSGVASSQAAAGEAVVDAAVSQAAAAPDVVGAVADAASPGAVLVQSTRTPCTCAKGSCGCCATIFRQKNCAHVSFLPEEFAFEMKMSMNGDVITKRKVPVGDPPPICFNPRRAPFLDLCAQIKNVHIRNRNVHLCVDINAGLGDFDLFSWNFNCIKFGNKGLFTGLNPEVVTPGGLPHKGGSIFGFFGGGNNEDDDYDEDDDDDDDLLDDY